MSRSWIPSYSSLEPGWPAWRNRVQVTPLSDERHNPEWCESPFATYTIEPLRVRAPMAIALITVPPNWVAQSMDPCACVSAVAVLNGRRYRKSPWWHDLKRFGRDELPALQKRA